MPSVTLMDDTFVVAAPGTLATRLASEQLWRQWWPRLSRRVHEDRGPLGQKWTLTGDLVGAGEYWLESFGDGTIVHYLLWADPPRRGSRTEPDTAVAPRRAARLRHRHTLAWKRRINALKDEVEAGRPPGAGR